MLRAKQLRKWAEKNGKEVEKITNNGIYVVYQQRNKDDQGHVYSVINGTVCPKDGDKWNDWNFQEFYKLN